MADYKAARAKTDVTEGGVNFNPDDLGNVAVKRVVSIPTYKGIAPRWASRWRGFAIINSVIASMVPMPKYGTHEHRTWCKTLNSILAGNAALQRYVDEFFETNYWHANRLGELISQPIAEWVYDHAVNAGDRGIMWAQLAARTKPDGELGPKTIAALNAMGSGEFLSRAADISGAYRLDRAQANPSQIPNLSSWLERDGQPAQIIALVRKAARDGRLDSCEVAALKNAMVATA